MENSGGLHHSNNLDSNPADVASTAVLAGTQQQQSEGMAPVHSLGNSNTSSSTSGSSGLSSSHSVAPATEAQTQQQQEASSSNQQLGMVGTSQASSSTRKMLGSQPKAQWLPQHDHSFKSLQHTQGHSQSLSATVQSINSINGSFDKIHGINNLNNLASNALLNAGSPHPGSTGATVGNHLEPTHPPPPASAPAIASGGRFSTNQQLPLLQPRPIQPAASATTTTSSSGSSSNPVVNPQHYPFQALSMTSQPQPLQEQQKRKDLNLFLGSLGTNSLALGGGGGGSSNSSGCSGSHPKFANITSSNSLLQDYQSNYSASIQGISDTGPPKEKDKEELAKMTPAERRRYERNLREQQRSYRISQQIKQLRDVLAESNIPFKPNKFSILVNVAEYIKQLQARAIMLDAEHQKLSNTINQTHQAIASGQIPSSGEDSDDRGDTVSTYSDEHELVMVQGINYTAVFKHCPFALGVSALDGRILTCNHALARLFGSRETDMNQQSLFLFIRNHQDVFEAMADLLKRSSVASETGEGVFREAHLLYWCGHVIAQNHRKLQFNITLTSTADSSPKYFNFSAAPVM